MQLRRLGQTNIQVSVVGFGTCQIRMVPEAQAIATLPRGVSGKRLGQEREWSGSGEGKKRKQAEVTRQILAGEKTQSEVARDERVSKSTISRMMSRIQGAG
jgi:hypothetical protein